MTTEVYLPDSRVEPVKDRLYAKYPKLFEVGTEFVTVRHEPPFTGQMPDGRVGATDQVILQFLLVSPHPRRWAYGRPGHKLTSQATLFEVGWLQAEQEYKSGHYVMSDKRDPLEVIYDGLAVKHLADLDSMSELMN